MYKHRYIEDQILEINKTFKVLYLSGPRQVGKTTTLKYLAKKFGLNYVSLDDLSKRKLAQNDPDLFLQRFNTPLFIDEVQYAPQLFPYIKINVDNSGKNGVYWLTGSQHFALMKNVKESLAGRVGIVNLLGFSMAEDLERKKDKKPFLPDKKITNKVEELDINTIFKIIQRGSFPVLTHDHPPDPEVFYGSYLQTYIDRDLRDIFNVSKIAEFHRFLQLCAARTGQMLNYSDLARDADISVNAAKSWINILLSSFQIFLLEPYYKNISKRLIKTPKMYFLDTGLAAFLAKWKTAETLISGAMAGPFLETFVISEIIKSYWHRGENPAIYYYRDKEGREIDLIIERNGILYPLEIKLSSSIGSSDFKNIFYLRGKFENIGKGAVICLSREHLPFDKQNDIIPVYLIS